MCWPFSGSNASSKSSTGKLAQISRLGQQIKQREIRLGDLRDQNEKQRRQLAAMRSPRYLELRIKDLNLSLARPEAAQVWRLPEPARARPAADGEQQLAARDAAAEAMP